MPLLVQIQVESCGERGTGSGTIVDDGTILTCYHVIRPFDKEPYSYLQEGKVTFEDLTSFE